MNSSLRGPFLLLENFGHSLKSPSYVSWPESVEDIAAAMKFARAQGLSLTLRGAGRSYNDAALNGGGMVLDLHRMNRILAWDPAEGTITVEPGLTVRDLWQAVLPDGWWPPVVSGTMTTTLGGCLGANIHGKNNYGSGTIGEHILQFNALLPTGAEITCSPKKNGDLFRAMIGGLGMLGVFTSITLQMKRVHSGLLKVHSWGVPNLEVHLQEIFDEAPHSDYVVGWMDVTARGRGMGRGQLHSASNLPEGEDHNSARTLRVDYQTLPDKFFGLVPKSLLHYFMKPFMNNLGAGVINTAKYVMSLKEKTYNQSHAAFHFLLDYIPDFERAYGELIEHQSFLPWQGAREAWKEMLLLSHRAGLPPYLGVTKRHRPDAFLLSHGVDGFSLALDFKVTASNRARLARLLEDFDRIVLEAGGRFYFVKNSETSPQSARRFLGDETIARFMKLKKRCDPDNLLESDLYRRLFAAQPVRMI